VRQSLHASRGRFSLPTSPQENPGNLRLERRVITQRFREEIREELPREELSRISSLGLLLLSILSHEEVLSVVEGLPSPFIEADANTIRSAAAEALKVFL